MTGVFGVHRGIWDHPLLTDDAPLSRREAWLWLISEAAWKVRRIRVAGVTVELKRGQLCHSLRHLARVWRWTVGRVRWFLHALASDGMIRTANDTGQTVLTICKYDDYQVAGMPERTPDDTATAQQQHKEEEGKKERLPDAETRARAVELAEQVIDIFGIDRSFIPPGWFGLEHWLEAGIRSGWKPDLVRLAARRAAHSRRKLGPPQNFRYLAPIVVEEHARAAPPPPPSDTDPQRNLNLIRVLEPRHEANRQSPAAPWQRRRDAWFDAVAELGDALAAPEDGGADSGGPAETDPTARRA